MRRCGDGNDAPEPLPLVRVVIHRDLPGRLHNLFVTSTVCVVARSIIRQDAQQTSLPHTAILRVVGSVESAHVNGRRIRAPRRRRPVRPTGASGLLVPASYRRL